ncbi:hypothetical protein BDF22DRAFT_667130 [Syncephalis plumigaleata]|nr:hypothetical protein BDF22DRAFT_667130 [Syncephalis plumigaleata]
MSNANSLFVLLTRAILIRVSSVLNRDTANYGKQHLIDGSEETCWNSDQQSPQYIALDFGRAVRPDTLQLMFQGGFVGSITRVLGAAITTMDGATKLEPFKLPALAAPIQRMKIIFDQSSDHYGRITVYRLEITETV